MFWEGSLLTAQSICLGTHKSMTQNLIRKLLSLVSKNLPKKLGRALKKKKYVCMFALNLGGKKKFHLLPFLISYLRSEWGWGEGGGEAGNVGNQGIRLCQGLEPGRFSFSPRGGKALTSLVTVQLPVLWCPLLTIQSPLSVVLYTGKPERSGMVRFCQQIAWKNLMARCLDQKPDPSSLVLSHTALLMGSPTV